MAAPSISFIGSGNLAWHLAPALDNMGFVVREVFSPNRKNATALTNRLYQAETKTSLDFSASTSTLFIIAVNDDSIQSVAQEIVLPEDAILVHTSGSKPLSALGYAATPNIGVFYPLQTFTRTKKINFKEVPIFIESESKEAERLLVKIGRSISNNVKSISSDERKALHVAAVFASNFTNHMLTISEDILSQYELDFDLLKPLIIETFNKSLAIGPRNAQTGPAIRGDHKVLDDHLDFLRSEECVSEIYQQITQHIIDNYETG